MTCLSVSQRFTLFWGISLNFPMLQARKHRFAMEDREAEAVRWQAGDMAGDNKLTITKTC